MTVDREAYQAAGVNSPQRHRDHREHREREMDMQEKPKANRNLALSFVCSFTCFLGVLFASVVNRFWSFGV